MFWKIAKSSNEVHYNKHVQEMQDLDIGAWRLLENKDSTYFCRVFFKEYVKCDSVDNNMVEIFNAFIIEHRFKPIVTMLEDIFRIIMTRVASKKKIAYHLDLSICPIILKKIEMEKNQ